MATTFRIKRFNPEVSSESYYRDYVVTLGEGATVLDGLLKVQAEQDDSVSFRYACRSAICGSCAVRVNGQAKLACKLQVAHISNGDSPIVVEPLGNLAVIRDLVVDFQPFWHKMEQVHPWLEPNPNAPKTEREYLVTRAEERRLTDVVNCIMCSACVSDCTVLEVDPNFLAPAALAKAQRFVADVRDGAQTWRLQELSGPGGVWDCTRCFMCVERCPKGVAPMRQILALREAAMEAGFTDNIGARHCDAIVDSIRESGWLDELKLPVRSVGFDPGALLGMVPVGLRAMMAGKLPSPIHPAIPNVEGVRKVFAKVEGDRKPKRKPRRIPEPS